MSYLLQSVPVFYSSGSEVPMHVALLYYLITRKLAAIDNSER